MKLRFVELVRSNYNPARDSKGSLESAKSFAIEDGFEIDWIGTRLFVRDRASGRIAAYSEDKIEFSLLADGEYVGDKNGNSIIMPAGVAETVTLPAGESEFFPVGTVVAYDDKNGLTVTTPEQTSSPALPTFDEEEPVTKVERPSSPGLPPVITAVDRSPGTVTKTPAPTLKPSTQQQSSKPKGPRR